MHHRLKPAFDITLTWIVLFLSVSAGHAARFVDNGDTVTDTRTGLIWEQKTDYATPDLRDKNLTYNWQQALEYCNDLNLGGHTDWRLPSIKELASLVDLSRNNPAIDPIFEQYTVTSYYWSSTTCADCTNHVWFVYFDHGGVSDGRKSHSGYVRAVRAGDGDTGVSDPLAIAIQCLQTVAEIPSVNGPDIQSDINGDFAIGLEEAIHSLQRAAGIR